MGVPSALKNSFSLIGSYCGINIDKETLVISLAAGGVKMCKGIDTDEETLCNQTDASNSLRLSRAGTSWISEGELLGHELIQKKSRN